MTEFEYHTLQFPYITYGSNLGAAVAGGLIGGTELGYLIRRRLLGDHSLPPRKYYPYLLAAGLMLGGLAGSLFDFGIISRSRRRRRQEDKPVMLARPLAALYYSPELEEQLLKQIGSL